MKEEFKDKSRKDQTKLIAALANLYNIKTKNFYYTVDDTGNRLHSNLTNLPKKLRKFLYCVVPGSDQKYPLEAVDIKNSQPFFSIIFFKNSLIHSSINNQHIIPPLLNTLNNSSTLYTILYNTLKHYSTLSTNNNTSIHYVSKEISIKSIKRLNRVNEEGYWGA